MKTKEKRKPMSIDVIVRLEDERLIQGRSQTELQQVAGEYLIIGEYLKANLSIGEVKEILGFRYMEEALNWLRERGITTWGSLGTEEHKISEKTMHLVLKGLNGKSTAWSK